MILLHSTSSRKESIHRKTIETKEMPKAQRLLLPADLSIHLHGGEVVLIDSNVNSRPGFFEVLEPPPRIQYNDKLPFYYFLKLTILPLIGLSPNP